MCCVVQAGMSQSMSQGSLGQRRLSQQRLSQQSSQTLSDSQTDGVDPLEGGLHSRVAAVVRVLQCDPSSAPAVEALGRLLLPTLERQLSGRSDGNDVGDDVQLILSCCPLAAEGAFFLQSIIQSNLYDQNDLRCKEVTPIMETFGLQRAF